MKKPSSKLIPLGKYGKHSALFEKSGDGVKTSNSPPKPLGHPLYLMIDGLSHQTGEIGRNFKENSK